MSHFSRNWSGEHYEECACYPVGDGEPDETKDCKCPEIMSEREQMAMEASIDYQRDHGA